MSNNLYRMADWDKIVKLLEDGHFVIRHFRRYHIRAPYISDANWPGAFVAGLTAPLFHSLGDAGLLKRCSFSYNDGDVFSGMNHKPKAANVEMSGDHG